MASLSYLPISAVIASSKPASLSLSNTNFNCSKPVSPSCSSFCCSSNVSLNFKNPKNKKGFLIKPSNRSRSFGGLNGCSSSTSPIYAAITTASELQSLKVMISGAPASGKGTQCEFITDKYGLVHISAGDLLRAEVAAGTESGKLAKEYMGKGMLVPDEIVVMMVKDRLLRQDAQENGWLLDGYPRSLSQANALEELGIRPDIFILLDVPEEILIERVVGRRLDPVTGKIYHLKYSPPENEEIAARLTHRFDDTEEKVKLRLQTHHQNVEAVLSVYKDIIFKVNGNVSKEDVFAQIDNKLSSILEKTSMTTGVSN